MASKIVQAGSKRPRDPSTQGLQVKFLINIPLKVDSEVEAQKTCCYLLDRLLIDGFKEEDRKFMKDKNGKEMLEDVAVIFGLNGKHTPELVQILKNLESFRYDCKSRYSIITYTWGSGGTIASDATETPYQDIREHLKNNAAATKLVQELRGNDRSCLVYFSFVDSDTFRFNFIYSEYLKIVSKELKKDPPIPPTVMSTGYEFTHEDNYHIASDLDRQIRTALAEVNPLFVYYPEPNFCVLVDDQENTIKESFIKRGRSKGKYKMESSVLIRQVKERVNFKAVFSNKNPIIILAPIRFKLSGEGLKTSQSTLNERNLAIGIYCNGVLKCKETYNGVNLPNDPQVQKGVYYKNLNFIKDLYKCDDKNFEELSKKNPFTINESDATELVEAIREARECRKLFEELNEKFKNY
ncbi:uncharacterized protein LOC131537097 [Onychostoma macrolepis]|uniref:Uncharacterized protein n=1 Tax=Onychostoma macrolepis TaxID=369639 RepID=A0A7J6DCD2_9TELE|nr:uncharacterized protein LOC131537097 [Onychostoma macrolepis]KAF4116524.1 hypothetical protein G5714_004013 [Onychostoma macrolepis]